MSIIIYGSHTCEDTAVARDRLNALQIKFSDRDKEEDEKITALLGKYNRGQPRTPTIVFGDDEIILVEPTLEQLEASLIQTGYTFDEPRMRAFNAKRYASNVADLPAVQDAPASTAQIAKTLLFFAHNPACRVCQGFAKQLAARCIDFEQAGVRLQIIVRADVKRAKEWAKEFVPGVSTRADVDGSFTRTAADNFPDTWDVRLGGTWVWLVNGEDVIRAGSFAPDAGGLASPSEILQRVAE